MSMVNWQVTATTVYCDAVDDEITIMVYKDWVTKCTGYNKYGKTNTEMLNILRKKRQLKRKLECGGPECDVVLQYKEKLLAEESRKG